MHDTFVKQLMPSGMFCVPLFGFGVFAGTKLFPVQLAARVNWAAPLLIWPVAVHPLPGVQLTDEKELFWPAVRPVVFTDAHELPFHHCPYATLRPEAAE